MANLSEDDFYSKWVPLLANNEFQNIDGPRFADLLLDLRDSYISRRSLNVRQVRGATYPVPYTDSLGLIPDARLIVGMNAVARDGQTQAQALLTFAPAPPVTFQLVANAGGPLQALTDEQPGTTATVPAVWVQVSGSLQQIVSSFPVLVVQNPDGSPHPYNAGDVFQYVFPSGTARLFQVRAYLNQASNPLPTGQDADAYYAPFAPLLPASASAVSLVRTGTVLQFDRDAEYVALASGTFTVDVTGATAGVVVNVRLEVGAGAPTLPAGFVLLSGQHKPGKRNRYSFCIAPDGSIEYYIVQLP